MASQVTRLSRKFVYDLIKRNGPLSTANLYELVPKAPIPAGFVPTPMPDIRQPGKKVGIPLRPDHPVRSQTFFKLVLKDLHRTSHIMKTHKREFVRNEEAKAHSKGKAAGREVHEWVWRIRTHKQRLQVADARKVEEPVKSNVRKVGTWTEVDAAKLLKMKAKWRAMVIAKDKGLKWNPAHSHLSKRRRLKRLAKTQARLLGGPEFDRLMYAFLKHEQTKARERAVVLAESAEAEDEEGGWEPEGEQVSRVLIQANSKKEEKDWVGKIGNRLSRLWKNPGQPS